MHSHEIYFLELAECLSAREDPATLEQVGLLMKLCPSYPNASGRCLISRRGENAILAITLFLENTSGLYREEIVPFLLEYLEALPCMQWQSHNGGMNIVKFVKTFVGTLGKLSTSVFPEYAASVAEAIVRVSLKLGGDILKRGPGTAESSSSMCFLGVLAGLESQIMLSADQADKLFGLFRKIIPEESETGGPSDIFPPLLFAQCKVAILRAIAALTYHTYAKEEALNDMSPFRAAASLSYAFKIAQRLISEEPPPLDIERSSDESALISQLNKQICACVHVIARCGAIHSSFSDEALHLLDDMFCDQELNVDATPEVVRTFKALMIGMADVAEHRHRLTGRVMSSLQSFLSSDSSFLIRNLKRASEDVINELVNEALNCISRIADVSNENGIECIWSLVFVVKTALSQQLTAVRSHLKEGQESLPVPNHPSPELICENLVSTLGKIACRFNDERVTQQILLILLRVLSSGVFLGHAVTDALTDVALLGDNRIFRAVFDTFVANSNPSEGSQLSPVVISGYERLTRESKDLDTKVFLFRAVSKMCAKVGSLAASNWKDSKNPSSSPGQELAVYLPTLSTLFAFELPPTSVSLKQKVRLFADVWFLIIFFELHKSERWLPYVRLVARSAPALLGSASKTDYLETLSRLNELVSFKRVNGNGAVSPPPNKTVVARIERFCGELSSLYGQHTPALATASEAELFFLSAVHNLECVRAQEGVSIAHMFDCLRNAGIGSSKLLPVYEDMAGLVVNDFLVYVKTQPATDEREATLVDGITVLLVNYCCQFTRARQVASQLIFKIFDAFPHLLYSATCLRVLFDIFEAVGKSCTTEEAEPVTVFARGHHIPENFSWDLVLPMDHNYRTKLLEKVKELTQIWLERAVQGAPVQTYTLLQDYLQSFDGLSSNFTHHIGFLSSEINRLMQKGLDLHQGQSGVVNAIPASLTPFQDSKWLGDLSSFAAASSFIALMDLKARHTGEMVGMVTLMESLQNPPNLTEMFLDAFETINEALDDGHIIDMAYFNNAMFQGAALLLEMEEVSHDLLRLLCWTPVHVFSPEALQVGTFVWTWIVNARPEVETILLTNLFQLWFWTKSQGLGVFESETAHGLLEDGIPRVHASSHRIWVGFFEERASTMRPRSENAVFLFGEFLSETLVDPFCLSLHWTALGPRFRLLCLGLRLVSSKEEWTVVLRDSVYNAALSWFCSERSWFQGSPNVLQEDLRTLAEFAELLKKDILHLQHAEASHESLKAVIENTKDRNGLILFLIGEELNRLYTWYNPLKHDDPLLEAVQPHLLTTNMLRGGEAMLRIAWRSSPELAVHLGTRFPEFAAPLQELIRSDPLAVIHVPDAAVLLASVDNVTADLEDLKHLVYWAPVGPAAAVSMLDKKYGSNARLTQYAAQVLHTFDPYTISFYIPQLVQALRHDFTGFVEKYVLDACADSPLICHQIIWNVKTYLARLENGEYREPDLGPIAQKVHDSVIENMPEKHKEFFNAQFGFWNAITGLSGVLQPLKDAKEPRSKMNVLLKERLAEISVPDRPAGSEPLYLPCDPDSHLVQIDYNSGACMSSAAKVPILVRFRVHNRLFDSRKVDKEGGNVHCIVPSRLLTAAPRGTAMHPDTQTHHPFVPNTVEQEGDSESDYSDSSMWTYSDAIDGDPTVPNHLSQPMPSPKFPMRPDRIPRMDLKAKKWFSVSNVSALTMPGTPTSTSAAVADGQSGSDLPGGTRSQPSKDGALPEGDSWKACIFKVGDDIRQDMLALQVMEIFANTWKKVSLPVFVYPYKVLATEDGCGILECVPISKSRDQLGKANDLYLKDYFIQKYGDEDTAEFQRARHNFIISLAPYSVITYILQIKDRHNGNVMIDDDGHIIHIDFGFMFDSSPGMDLRFERSPFKMCEEYFQMLGGNHNNEFMYFWKTLVVRCYLAIRPRCADVVALARMMSDTDLPCYRTKSLERLIDRFKPNLTPREAADFMLSQIDTAFGVSAWKTTDLYDKIQQIQGGIWYKPGT